MSGLNVLRGLMVDNHSYWFTSDEDLFMHQQSVKNVSFPGRCVQDKLAWTDFDNADVHGESQTVNVTAFANSSTDTFAQIPRSHFVFSHSSFQGFICHL